MSTRQERRELRKQKKMRLLNQKDSLLPSIKTIRLRNKVPDKAPLASYDIKLNDSKKCSTKTSDKP